MVPLFGIWYFSTYADPIAAGYINKASLEILSQSDVKSINFAPSLYEENGLNIHSQAIYSGDRLANRSGFF